MVTQSVARLGRIIFVCTTNIPKRHKLCELLFRLAFELLFCLSDAYLFPWLVCLVWFWGFLAIAEVGGRASREEIAVAEVMLSVSAWEYRRTLNLPNLV